MKKHKISIALSILISLFLLSSCGIFSLHPLYHETDLIVKTELIGTWQKSDDKDMFILIESIKDKKYKFTMLDKSDTVYFEMGLIKLSEQYFVDLFPGDECTVFGGDGDCLGLDNLFRNYIPAHTFMKFEMHENEIALTEFDNERLITLFHENKIRLAHEIPDKEDNDGYVVITASTNDLQKFITRYANDKEAFDETEKYHRL